MPLQNRVTPEGAIIATPGRGMMMGNRGGALHTPERTLGTRRWKSKAWICCLLEFKDRHRVVMSPNRYTELFFLDEATALAAGHRPCFECRRRDALRFAEAWRLGHGLQMRPSAPDMDDVLHPQRIGEECLAANRHPIASLPDGVFVRWQDGSHLLLRGRLLPWKPQGYAPAVRAPPGAEGEIITPPAIVTVLSARYRPMVHPTADRAA